MPTKPPKVKQPESHEWCQTACMQMVVQHWSQESWFKDDYKAYACVSGGAATDKAAQEAIHKKASGDNTTVDVKAKLDLAKEDWLAVKAAP